MRLADLLEMSVPTDAMRSDTYWHGTDNTAAAKGILSSGIRPQDIETLQQRYSGDKSIFIPQEGKVYLTTVLERALWYAWREPEEDEYGYVFEIPGHELADVGPDEDYIGSALFLINDPHNDIEAYVDVSLIPQNYKDELVGLAKEYLTPEQYRDVLDYNSYEDFVVAGKILEPHLSDGLKLALINASGQIAHTGIVRPSKCYRFSKEVYGNREKELTMQEFFAIAEEWNG